MKKKRYKGLMLVLSVVIFAFCVQGCSNNEDTQVNEKIDLVENSDDFKDFVMMFSIYQEKTVDAINSMSAEERTLFFQNTNNDKEMALFLEKNDLIKDNIELQKRAYHLSNNKDYVNLQPEEQIALFKSGMISDNLGGITRLKSGSESECEQRFQDKFTNLNIRTGIKILACTCILEVPIAACICYAGVMADHYSELDNLLYERDRCMGK